MKAVGLGGHDHREWRQLLSAVPISQCVRVSWSFGLCGLCGLALSGWLGWKRSAASMTSKTAIEKEVRMDGRPVSF